MEDAHEVFQQPSQLINRSQENRPLILTSGILEYDSWIEFLQWTFNAMFIFSPSRLPSINPTLTVLHLLVSRLFTR